MTEKKDRQQVNQGRARLSVCMIVKNEEKLLPQCLRSVESVADEIIIVDTGSTDRTMEIAREFGAKVYEHPWQKNFSLHRNQSISYATGDWILQIDADEELAPESREELRRLIDESPADVNGYSVVIVDVRADGQKGVRFNYPRLFRNNVGAYYQGIVHNQVIIPGKVSISNVILYHYGYDLDPKSMRRKFKRSTSLLRKLARENPEDPMPWFYLACTYSQYQKPVKAVYYSRKSIELLRKLPDAPQFYLSIYQALVTGLLKLGRIEEAEEAAQESIRVEPKYIDGYYHLAKIYYIQKRFTESVRFAREYFRLYKRFLKQPEYMGNVSIYSVDRVASVLYVYGVALLALGRRRSGLAAIRHAIDAPGGRSELAIEACHNLAVVDSESSAREMFEHLYNRFANDGPFVLSIAADLASMDRLAWLADPLRNDCAPREDGGSTYVGILLDWLRGKTPDWSSLENCEDEHVRMLAEALVGDGGESDPDVELSRCLVLYDRLARRIGLGDEELLRAIDHKPAGDESHLDRLLTEILTIRSVVGILHAISEENIESLLRNLTACCNLLQITLPAELDDATQIARLLIDIFNHARSHGLLDAALAAAAAAGALFPQEPQISAMRFQFLIERGKNLAGFPESLRVVLKFFYPPERMTSRIQRALDDRIGRTRRRSRIGAEWATRVAQS